MGGQGARREGAGDCRASFYVGDDPDYTARNEHTDEDNHGSWRFHCSILHHTFELARFPGLAPGPQPRKRRIAIVPDLLSQTGKHGDQDFVWLPAAVAGRAQAWASLLIMCRFRCEHCSSRYNMEMRAINSAQFDSGTSV